MKKLILLIFVFAGFIACESEGIDEPPQGTSIEEGSTSRKKAKTDVCHKGNIINVSVNALEGHQGHGDAIDMDGDGYFDIKNECSEVDCNDTDPNVNPSSEEVCDNQIDDNCNGETDEVCAVCLEYEWGEYLNSIDLINACDLSGNSVDEKLILTNGLNNDRSSGFAIAASGEYAIYEDGIILKRGFEEPESYQCFLDFMEEKNIPKCPFGSN